MQYRRTMRRALGSGVLGLALVLSACGGEAATSTPVPPAATNTPMTAPATNTPAAMTAPTLAPGGNMSVDPVTITQGMNLPKLDGVTLNLLVWEGYSDKLFAEPFEKATGAKITASFMGSSDELVAKLKGGGDTVYDLISPSSDVAGFIVQNALAQPVDLAAIPNYKDLAPRLTGLSYSKKDGQTYGVPFTWGPDPLIYDKDAIPTAPESWSILWDPAVKGKVSVWDDISTIYLAAQVLGIGKANPSELYNMTDEQLDKVKAKLLELKPQIRKFWATGGDLTNLFDNKEVTVAVGWPLTTSDLKKKGRNIGELIPKEGTTGWIDHWMVTAASKQQAAAQAWINYAIDPRVQKLVADVTNYGVANPKTVQYMPAEQAAGIHINDMDNYMKPISFWEPVPRRDKYNEVWNEVKAAP